jgi:hypothetical protein
MEMAAFRPDSRQTRVVLASGPLPDCDVQRDICFFFTWYFLSEEDVFDDKSVIQGQSHFMTGGESVSPSWCRAPFGDHDQILSRQLRLCR